MIKPALVASCDTCGAMEFAAQISHTHMEEHLKNLGWELHKAGYVNTHPHAHQHCAKCVSVAALTPTPSSPL